MSEKSIGKRQATEDLPEEQARELLLQGWDSMARASNGEHPPFMRVQDIIAIARGQLKPEDVLEADSQSSEDDETNWKWGHVSTSVVHGGTMDNSSDDDNDHLYAE